MILEKRKNPRFGCSNPKNYPLGFKTQEGAGCLHDLSRQGMAIEFSHHLEKDKDYKFEIWVSTLERPVSCEARVLWVRSQPERGNYLCGAKILQMDPATKIDLLGILYQDWKQKALTRSQYNT